ncbi:hypothetical protein CC79DRAFT_1373744 [Sarocladium strictum]
MTNTTSPQGQTQVTGTEDPLDTYCLDALYFNDLAGAPSLEDSRFSMSIGSGHHAQKSLLSQQALDPSGLLCSDVTGNAPIPSNGDIQSFREWMGSTAETFGSKTKSLVLYSHYQFLTISNIHTVPYGDVNYLESQGCFHVPNPTTLELFLRSYFMHVHLLFPFLDEGDFWDMYFDSSTMADGSKATISLLVLRAMIFAACNFVPFSALQDLGYHDVSTARADLYRKTKVSKLEAVSGFRDNEESKILHCLKHLAIWYQAVHVEYPVFHATGEAYEQPDDLDPAKCAVLYTNLMYIYYYTSCLMLCNREILDQTSQQAIGNSEICYKIVRHVLGITECVRALTQYNLVMYLPVTV